MKIWIDADAAPREARDIVFRAAARTETHVTMVANQRMPVPPGNDWVDFQWVTHGADEADRFIVENAAAGDIALTADIPLAASLVENEVHVLDFRGEAYTKENVGERLSIRDFMQSMRDVGVDTGGPSAWGAREKREFAGALDRLLTRLGRS